MTPLIVGAGPVGLAAGVFLAAKGIKARLIDSAEAPARRSKALAANPRTMDLLEPLGLTQKLFGIGNRMLGANFSYRGKRLAHITFEALPHKNKFMLALSQASTEQTLAEEFQRQGGVVERGVEFISHRRQGNEVLSTLRHTSGREETMVSPWILGADGAHSAVRKSAGIGFPGSVYPELWELFDMPIDVPLSADEGHVQFLPEGGFWFFIRVFGDAGPGTPEGETRPIWRLLGNVDRLLERIPKEYKAGAPIWHSTFRIAHRIADRFAKDGIYLAGDAAHIHSPIGARGMNLGIEDAWVFAELASRKQLDRYERVRRPIDAALVKRINRVTWMARGMSPASRFLRRYILPLVVQVPLVRRPMLRMFTGLDHDVRLE